VTTITVLGGGAVVTPQLARALADEPALAGERIDLRLVGRDKEKLERVAAAAHRASAGFGACQVEVSSETDAAAALEGADVIVNQVRPGGLAGRAFDERFPRQFGLPGEETMGPGGFASAWRTLPVVEQLFRLCRQVAPRAKVLNLTNPAGMVHQVAARAELDVLTLCDSPLTLADAAAAAAGVDATRVVPGYVGTNHGGWLTSLRLDGEDVLPRALDHADELGGRLGVAPALLRWLQALPNAYLRYLYHPDRQLEAQAAKSRVRAEELLELEAQALNTYGAGSDGSDIAETRRALWYTACIAPVIGGLVSGRALTTIVGVTNNDLLPWLPAQTMLELAAEVDEAVQVLPIDTLAPESRALLLTNAAYEALTVDAILAGDRDACVRALAANPLVASLDVAEAAVGAIERECGALSA
jgi:6-phospho-beta-glucosidase